MRVPFSRLLRQAAVTVTGHVLTYVFNLTHVHFSSRLPLSIDQVYQSNLNTENYTKVFVAESIRSAILDSGATSTVSGEA